MKTKITVTTVGHMPANFNRQAIKEWRSSVFEIVDGIESYTLSANSDGVNWEYTDKNLKEALPEQFKGEFLISIVNVPIELNWYSRRLNGNRVVFSFHEIKEILDEANIPLENVIYRLLYAYVLIFKRSNNRIPTGSEKTNFTHDETRGCLFDMNGIKTDIIYSCHRPTICSDCIQLLKYEKVSNELILQCQRDIRRIQRKLFYRISDFIKRHPLWSIAISMTVALALNIVAAFIYEAIKR